MPSFSLVVEYLTGYAVATDPSDREGAEWPPHPARVYMALAAAHFETDGPREQKRAEREALEWLATLPPPNMTIPEHSPRDVQTVYVPVNDQPGGEALLKRSRQPRFFPRVYIGSEPLRQTWHVPDEPPAGHLDALESVCRSVTRIGHSSSLVWARLERNGAAEPTHVPDEHALENGLRIVQAGAMGRLEGAFNKATIDEFAALEEEISLSNSTARKQLQSDREARFPRGRPTSQRAVFSISRGYRRVEPARADTPHTLFDPNFIVLREADDATQSLGLESTAQVTHALRGLLMSESRAQPVPSWVGGHEPNGAKLESGPHLALIPLAFVGRPGVDAERHADGHLMGLGIVLPRSISSRERAEVLASILFDGQTNEPRTLHVRMGGAGDWRVTREASTSPRYMLRTPSYTEPSASWASVTPILLDSMPKGIENPVLWRDSVAGVISESCKNIGLPRPIAVRIEKTPFFLGSLRAMPGQGGFPRLRKDKFQVHVALEFDRPVMGPVLLGAGRFRGYGLMRPWAGKVGR